MKPLALLVVLVFSPGITRNLCAQDVLPYPSMKEVMPTVSVLVQAVDSEYQYAYSVTNGVDASQQIRKFMIQIRSASASGIAPSDWWASRATRPGLAAVNWTSLDSTRDISPGSMLSEFQIASPGLPAIVQFYAVGRIPIPHGEFRVQPGTNDIFVNSAQGRTIGPLDPASPFVALSFLDTLISMKNEAKSEELQWIKVGDLSVLIDENLETVRTYLEEKNESEAAEVLQSTLNAVMGECEQLPPDPDLTPEACALLQFNMEYLLEQIE